MGKLADEMLEGAEEIALELFGDKAKRRKIYGMSAEQKRELGIFNIGKIICARKTTLRERIAAKEAGQS